MLRIGYMLPGWLPLYRKAHVMRASSKVLISTSSQRHTSTGSTHSLVRYLTSSCMYPSVAVGLLTVARGHPNVL